jgi:hypothetical protein
MTDPNAPSPFRPNPTTPATGGRGGCSKPLFVGCGILLLLLGIGAIVFVVRAPALFQWWLRIVEEKVTAVVPDDVTPEERAALHHAFADMGQAFAHGGQPDARYLQRFQTELMAVISKPKGQVTRQEILELTRVLELTAGKRVPPAPVPTIPGAAPLNPTPPPTPVPKT